MTSNATFGKNRDALLENDGKMHEEGYVDKFFRKLACISQLHYEFTSSHITLKDFKEMNAFEWLLLALV